MKGPLNPALTYNHTLKFDNTTVKHCKDPDYTITGLVVIGLLLVVYLAAMLLDVEWKKS